MLLRSQAGYSTAPPSATSSGPTVLSTLHSRQRKAERKITTEELQVFSETPGLPVLLFPTLQPLCRPGVNPGANGWFL